MKTTILIKRIDYVVSGKTRYLCKILINGKFKYMLLKASDLY